MNDDLSLEDLRRINAKIERLLKLRLALPLASLQYRASEVGQVRLDARALSRAVAELADNRRPRRGKVTPGPWQPVPGILVYSELGREEAAKEAEAVGAKLREIASLSQPAYFDDWIAEVCDDLPDIRVSNGEVKRARRRIGAGYHIPVTETRTLVRTKSGTDLYVWQTHDTEWLYPDDESLWRFLSECGTGGLQPVILARKIAPATFPVLKRIGAFGLQYYSYLVEPPSLETLQQLSADIGWFHVQTLGSLTQKQVAQKARSAVRTLSTQQMSKESATQMTIALESMTREGDRTEHLLEWARHAGMPENWIATNSRWLAMKAYRRKSYRDDEGVPDAPAQGTRESAFDQPGSQAESDASHATDEHNKVGFGRETVVTRVPLRLRW